MSPTQTPTQTPTPTPTPYEVIGTPAILALVERFYDHMESAEPELARLHPPHDGTIPTAARARFALFLVGWLGGPQTYTEQHGHPRLRMRHATVPIGTQMRDAWLRCMSAAMDVDPTFTGPVRDFLDSRFAEVADFLRNQPS